VHKYVERLRESGLAVASAGGAGYRLESPFTDLVVPEAVLPLLLGAWDPGREWTAGLPYRYVPECGSTNTVLRQEAAFSPSGTVVVTDEQTGGRGRLGRTWVSRPGEDLTLSLLLRPVVAPAQAHLLSLTAALAVAEAVEALPGLRERVRVKWPNDVLIDSDKVCGVLVEGSMTADRMLWAIVGIGLNVNSDPAVLVSTIGTGSDEGPAGRPQPTSLKRQLGRKVSRGPLLVDLLCRLTERLNDVGSAGLLEGLRRRDALLGDQVEVFSGPPENRLMLVGEAAGIGPEGQLLVRDAKGMDVPVFAGEVTVNHFQVRR